MVICSLRNARRLLNCRLPSCFAVLQIRSAIRQVKIQIRSFPVTTPKGQIILRRMYESAKLSALVSLLNRRGQPAAEQVAEDKEAAVFPE